MSDYGEEMKLAAIHIEAEAGNIQTEAQALYAAILSRNLMAAMSSVAKIARISTSIDIDTVQLMELLSLDHSESNTESRKHVAMWAIRIRSATSADDATRLLQSFAIQTMEAALNRTIDILTNIVGVTPPDE